VLRRTTMLLAIALATAACGAGDDGGDARVRVVAGFYPIAWAGERVGGNRVSVADLTPSGAEPHDLELTPDQADELLDADVVLLMGEGFQPAVEDAAEQRDGPTIALLDTLPASDLEAGDPHVWLDPVLMEAVVGEIEAALVEADPEGKTAYRRNADGLRGELERLDSAYRAGVAGCERDLVVTAHDAFGYLTDRYGLRDEGVAGLSPDAEPDARRLAELADLAREEGVTTVFTEELFSPEIAETLAREAGGLRTAVLSTLESLDEKERDAGGDYVTVMEDNLAKLRTALGCR
jgi:zinc transport system substrate-binding protein